MIFIAVIRDNACADVTCTVDGEICDGGTCKCGGAASCEGKKTGAVCDATNNVCKCSATVDKCTAPNQCTNGMCGM